MVKNMVIHTKLYNSEVVPTKFDLIVLPQKKKKKEFDLIAKHFSLEEPKQV